MEPAKRITVEERERAIFKFLKEEDRADAGATLREIWEGVSERLGDTVTQQAYYKVLDRLGAVGKIDLRDEPDAKRYAVAKHLHVDNAVTLDDVYELLETLAPSDAIARLLDARDYYEERRDTTLRRAAEELLKEDPVDLIHAMIVQKTNELRADLAMHRDEELAARELWARFEAQFRDLEFIAYRALGLSARAVDLGRRDSIRTGRGRRSEIVLDEDQLWEELKGRIFGVHFINRMEARKIAGALDRASVAGSDGSTHASVMQLATAGTFTADVGHQVVTFNNSVVYVKMPDPLAAKVPFPYYSVPMSRSAIDDKGNRGMVIAPFMFRYLSESEYDHMALCATDVVQWRADAAVFLGTARSPHDGTLLPRPLVQIRDGTVTPQEREYGHYKRQNEYGEMVREGVTISRKILEKLLATEKPPVFAGAVKSTQSTFFGTVLNWYIAKGSTRRLGAPLDPNWDTTRAAHIADNEAMSFLLSSLPMEPGAYYVSCAVMRPFHTLTEFYRTPTVPDDEWDWTSHFEAKLADEQDSYDKGLTPEPPHLAGAADVADDDFVFMCRKADYVSFYVGHTAGDPPPIAPRYEFMESLRALRVDERAQRVARNVGLVVAALDRTGFSADSEHNFMTKKFLIKMVPFVTFDAHEKCKAIGRQLESELRSIAVANLQALRNLRNLKLSDVEFVPLSIRRFIERFADVVRDDEKRDPDKDKR